jgi:hypothetical protein
MLLKKYSAKVPLNAQFPDRTVKDEAMHKHTVAC